MNWLGRFIKKHTCRDAGIQLDPVKQEGFHPQVRLRLICKHTGWVLGEAYFNPDGADALATEMLRLSGNVRGWTDSSR